MFNCLYKVAKSFYHNRPSIFKIKLYNFGSVGHAIFLYKFPRVEMLISEIPPPKYPYYENCFEFFK